MNGQMVFKLLLILTAGIVLVAIVIHYNSAISNTGSAANAAFRAERFEVDSAPDFTAPSAPGAPMGAEEAVYAVPAPVSAPPQVSMPPGESNPADVLQPADLLPRLGNTAEEQKFAQLYSTGQGDMQGINFLDAGSQIGLSTRCNRNANLQLRSDPQIEKQPLPFMFSTIESDRIRKPLEIGSMATSVPA